MQFLRNKKPVIEVTKAPDGVTCKLVGIQNTADNQPVPVKVIDTECNDIIINKYTENAVRAKSQSDKQAEETIKAKEVELNKIKIEIDNLIKATNSEILLATTKISDNIIKKKFDNIREFLNYIVKKKVNKLNYIYNGYDNKENFISSLDEINKLSLSLNTENTQIIFPLIYQLKEIKLFDLFTKYKNQVTSQTKLGGAPPKPLKKSKESILISGKKHTIYLGPRSGKYIKKDKKYVSLSTLKKD